MTAPGRGLRTSYGLLAPVYDLAVKAVFAAARRQSLAALPLDRDCHVLINGIGTGLDLPDVPRRHRYTALDLSRPMLARAVRRGTGLDISWVQGDSMALPFPPGTFDCAVLHLILAIVPDATRALSETARVLKPGGRILILDKFLRPGQRAPLRRLISPILARIATRTDVVFEEALQACPELHALSDVPVLAGGWVRRIELERRRPPA